MKRIAGIAVVLAALITPAHAKSPSVTTTTDRFTGVTTVKMKPEDVVVNKAGCVLSLGAVAASDETPGLVLVVDCYEWQFLKGVTAHALIDGQRVDFDFNEIAAKVPTDGIAAHPFMQLVKPFITHEVLVANAPKAVFDRFANCQSFEMEIGSDAFSMKAKGLQPFQEFDAALSTLKGVK